VVELAQNLFSSRRSSIIVGAVAAALAGIVLIAYLYNYRNSINASAAVANVLVAKNPIQKGTPGDVIASTGLFQIAQLPKSELRTGAITDPATLRGRVALTDVYQGQQLTAADFTPIAVDTLGNHLRGDQRAISVTIDGPHGLNNQLANGDHIDIFVGLNKQDSAGSRPVVKLLMKDITVLRAPLAGVATLLATEKQAAVLAWAVDNGRLWFVLRPGTGALTPNPGLVTADDLLQLKPVR
jgi:Flp pilus assembly protein CpaB